MGKYIKNKRKNYLAKYEQGGINGLNFSGMMQNPDIMSIAQGLFDNVTNSLQKDKAAQIQKTVNRGNDMDETQQMGFESAVSNGLIKTGNPIAMGVGAAVKLGGLADRALTDVDCVVDPQTGKEICVDTTKGGKDALGTALNPVGMIGDIGSNLLKGDVKGALEATPWGQILSAKRRREEAEKTLNDFRGQISTRNQLEEEQRSGQANLLQEDLRRRKQAQAGFGQSSFIYAKQGGLLRWKKQK